MGMEYTICADVWSTGLSILELVENRFPYPSDLAPVDLIMYITTSEVGLFYVYVALMGSNISHGQPPLLEDEPDLDVPWSEPMKEFIALS